MEKGPIFVSKSRNIAGFFTKRDRDRVEVVDRIGNNLGSLGHEVLSSRRYTEMV